MSALFYDWKEKIDEKELNNVIEIINKGGIIIFPTDTVYGIGCSSLNEEAIIKLFEFKERNNKKPICVLTSTVEKIKKVAYIKDEEKNLINKYMPGALTIILDKKEEVSNILTSNLNTIGVRIPNNEIALKILEKLDYPLATTSANISGNSTSIEVKDFINDFKDKVDVIIDGGQTDLKISSTIVKFTNKEIEVLRQGTLKIKE